MIELAQHIETLLLENDCVIVPGFGGFVAHYSPATRVKEENIFLPPTRTIGFNPQLKLNDGVLVQSYMSAYDTSFADASRIVEKEVNEFIGLLHEEGKAHLDNIGEIQSNIYGNYELLHYMVSTLLKYMNFRLCSRKKKYWYRLIRKRKRRLLKLVSTARISAMLQQ